MLRTRLPYYYHSTRLLHFATVAYVLMVLAFPPNLITFIYGLLYTLETVLKVKSEGEIYLSHYYGLFFRVLDILAGPGALICCLYELAEG